MFSPSLRHRLGALLLVLGVWLQALAPGLALARLAPDPLAGAILCGHTDARAVASEDEAPAACPACPFCAGIATAPLVPTGPALPRRTRWHAVAWATPPPCRSLRRPRPPGQPRAPPRRVRSHPMPLTDRSDPSCFPFPEPCASAPSSPSPA
ncbi:hypothetical protein [Methylobacterium gossipiicola]|uniref:DUF2946 domain-containing protein n=1 Tax=Methylobacterium gossipiicola TaxID=582675 RepID=A0A1I2VRQ3_9HYPH|nr:hypothetical protein [Methylobacterium gossipiicola]SFG92004.1 hypothetical protein SAMN05192565_11720 [Methylobacterium gossipiicola]